MQKSFSSFKIDALNLGVVTSTKFKIHPMVPLQILEAFYRKHKDQEFVIGTLLGESHQDGIEITNCYPIQYETEEDDPSALTTFDQSYHLSRYKLNKQVYTKEKVLGWFTTQVKIGDNHAMLHKFYENSKRSKFSRIRGQLSSPLILTLDPTITKGNFDMRVFPLFSPPGLHQRVSLNLHENHRALQAGRAGHGVHAEQKRK